MTLFLQPAGNARVSVIRDSSFYYSSGLTPVFAGAPGWGCQVFMRVGETLRVYHPLLPKGLAVAVWTSDPTIATLSGTLLTAISTGRCTVALETGGLRGILYVHVVPAGVFFLDAAYQYGLDWNVGNGQLAYPGYTAARGIYYPPDWNDDIFYTRILADEPNVSEPDRRGLQLVLTRTPPTAPDTLYTFTVTNDNVNEGTGEPNVDFADIGITPANVADLAILVFSVADMTWDTAQQFVLPYGGISIVGNDIVFTDVDFSAVQAAIDTGLWQESVAFCQLRVPDWDVVHIYPTDATDL